MSEPQPEVEADASPSADEAEQEQEQDVESKEHSDTEGSSEFNSDSEDTDSHDDTQQTTGEKRGIDSREGGEADTSPTPKKAKIAHPPAVSSLLTDVDEYTLDAPPTAENTDDDRINTPSLILFGLHPLVKEPPLRKLCEKFGDIKSIGVRSAFASRYGHVEYSNVQQAKDAYRALNGAKLLHKPILVQPTKAEATT